VRGAPELARAGADGADGADGAEAGVEARVQRRVAELGQAAHAANAQGDFAAARRAFVAAAELVRVGLGLELG
jgi:hypothetical protein